MVRASKITLPLAGQHISRRCQRQFVPSIAETASCLEDRVLLSAAGGKAHAAEVARPMADTAAGKKVTSLFESILHTAPSSQQLTQWVDKLHHGVSAKVLRKDLTAEVKAQQKMQIIASRNAAVIADDPVITSSNVTGTVNPSSTTGTINPSSITGTINPSSITGTINPSSTIGTIDINQAALQAAGLSGFVNSAATPVVTTGGLNVSQMPAGYTFTMSYGGSTPSTTSTGTVSTTALASLLNALSSTGTSGAVSANGLTNLLDALSSTGTTSSSTLSLSSTELSTLVNALSESGLTSLLGSSVNGTSPLESLLTSGSVATPGSTTTGTISSLTPGALTISPLTFTPVTVTLSPINPSPLPLNGTLPFTGTPANPSPLPLNGTLPFTGTPVNPSPVPTTGVLG